MQSQTTDEQRLKKSTRLRHVPELDGIRGLAALVVYFHHACYVSLQAGTVNLWAVPVRVMYGIFEYGNTGVDLFFVLSGFLITSVLLEERGSTRYYQDFYWKRALRILPLYVVCLLGVLLFRHEYGYVLLASVFLVNFASVIHVAGLGPFWTLAIEEQFYLLWPTVVRRRKAASLMRWSIALGCLAVVLRALFAGRGHYNYYLSFLRCDGLAFGAGLACWYRESRQQPKRNPATAVLGGLLLAGVLLLAASNAIAAIAVAAAVFQTGVVLVSGSAIGLAVLYSGAAALAVFRSRLLVFFGLISYALYMVHIYVLVAWDHFFGDLTTPDNRAYWMRLCVCFAISVLLAMISRYTIELPAMRLRKYVLSHPTGKKVEAGTAQLPLARMD